MRPYHVIKARIGNVIIKRVGDAWHVYALGPIVWADSFEAAVSAAQRMDEAQGEVCASAPEPEGGAP